MKKVLVLGVAMVLLAWSVGVSQKTVESGKFLYQITKTTENKTEVAGEETFKIEELDGNKLKLESNFLAKSQELVVRFGTDKLFKQEITMDKDWKLLAYELQSDTAQGKLQSKVQVEGRVAKIEVTLKKPDGTEQKAERKVILEDEFVTTGLAATQFLVLQKIIAARMKETKKTFLALDPTNLERPLVEMVVEKLSPVKVKSGSETKEAQRVSVAFKDDRGELFRLDMLGQESTLWALTGQSGTSKLLIYRADLFPKGFEVLP